MSGIITGKEYPLEKIFSSDFEYHIPAYQRPYAWTKEESGTLFDDLYDFYTTTSDDNYFLGSIVLIKEENKPYAEVIDGQQRLTTLTILFSAMSSFLSGDTRQSCLEYIMEKGKVLAGIPSKPRLHLRERDQQFFFDYIQSGKIEELSKIDIGSSIFDTEAKKHIKENAELLAEKFADTFHDENDIIKFCTFILNKCFLVVVSTSNQKSAFRVFSVMNSRGLDLLPVDIIKSDIIGELPASEQQKYTDKWENLENKVGRDGFNDVFTHTRTIFAMEKQKKSLLEEFRQYVVSRFNANELIDKVLTPYTEAYADIKMKCFASTSNAEQINYYLYWLNKIDNSDWMPVAIKFFASNKNDSAYILWFVKKLERIAAYLLVTAKDINQRMSRYKWIIAEMDNPNGHSLSSPLKTIELTPSEKREFIETLSGEVYLMPSKRRNYILQRLDSFVADGAATYDTTIFTIEHVLPQTPPNESEWLKIWSDVSDRKYWLNRIANLVPLTKQKNSSAQNYDFDIKKAKYFQSQNGVSSYALTTQVLSTQSWTPDVVKARQNKLMSIFSDKWELDITTEDITIENGKTQFHLAARSCNASGYTADDGKFIVKAGSVVSTDEVESFKKSNYSLLREQLIHSKIISNGVFTQNYAFESVSAAAAVCCGRAANGRKEWSTIDGRPYSKVIEN